MKLNSLEAAVAAGSLLLGCATTQPEKMHRDESANGPFLHSLEVDDFLLSLPEMHGYLYFIESSVDDTIAQRRAAEDRMRDDLKRDDSVCRDEKYEAFWFYEKLTNTHYHALRERLHEFRKSFDMLSGTDAAGIKKWWTTFDNFLSTFFGMNDFFTVRSLVRIEILRECLQLHILSDSPWSLNSWNLEF